MKLVALLGAAVIAMMIAAPAYAAGTFVLPPASPSSYDALCRADWTKRGVLNQDMYQYCVNLNEDGYDKFADLATKYSHKLWIQPLVNFISAEWTKHGLRNDSQVGYEMGLQLDAYENLVYAKDQLGFSPAILKGCLAAWGVQFTQVEYCYKHTQDPDGPSPNPRIDLGLFAEFFNAG